MASQPKPPPRPKTRGNYNCGRCGQPKKGHVCVAPVPVAAPSGGGAPSPSPSTSSGAASASGGGGGGEQRLRRALSFDEAGTPSSPEKKPKVEGDVEMDVAGGEGEMEEGGDEDDDAAVEVGGRPVPGEVMAEVLRRLGPRGVMAAAGVNRGWRDCAGRVWRAADELRLRVLASTGAGLLGALLPRCPALSRLDLRMERDVDATTLACLAFSCPSLKTLEITMAANAINRMTGGLCMLSLILGSKITDAAVASIVRLCTSLELLDLSGSSISDNGVGMICKAFPHTLSRLLLALCPNVTTRGIQLATAQLPHLQLMDCGMSLCANLNNEKGPMFGDINGGIRIIRKLCASKNQPIHQKLIIKHGNLKKLSLWGCSAIDALYVNCPELNDLNLNSCTNLHPERLVLQCPNLKNVHAVGCQDMLIGAIRNQVNQVLNEFTAAESSLPCKLLADGSKRVQLPQFQQHQPPEDDKLFESSRTQCTVHLHITRAS